MEQNISINITNILLGLLIIVILVGGGMFFLNNKETNVEKATINVRGEAVKTVTPDLVNIGFTIETTANASSESISKNSAELARIKRVLLASGIKENEIESTTYITVPEYNESCDNYCYPVPIEAISARPIDSASSVIYPGTCERNCNIVGQKTIHSITIKSKEINRAGEFAQKVIDTSNISKIDYAYFTLSEEAQIRGQNELEAQAAKVAREKAQNIARELNTTLGRLVSINPETGYGYPMPMYAYDKSGFSGLSEPAVPSQIFPTDVSLRAAVTAVYEIN